MVREVAALSPFQSARFVEQPTSRTIRLPLSRASADRSQTIRLKAFSPLLLRQKTATRRDGRKRRSEMVQMVRELTSCGFGAYATNCGSFGNGCAATGSDRLVTQQPRGGHLAEPSDDAW